MSMSPSVVNSPFNAVLLPTQGPYAKLDGVRYKSETLGRRPFVAVEIQYVTDPFALYPEVLVHPVSCMGLARDTWSKQLKKTLPAYFRHYSRSVLRGHLRTGFPEIYDLDALFGTRHVIVLPLRGHWKETLLPPLVKEALAHLWEALDTLHPKSLAMPEFEGPPAGWLAEQFQKRSTQTNFSMEVYLIPSENHKFERDSLQNEAS
jgi:hypothetical protein